MIDYQTMPSGGIFYVCNSEETFYYSEFKLDFCDMDFMCCYRERPFWPKAVTGKKISEIPLETQFVLFKDKDIYTVCFALVDDKSRSSLRGGDALYICTETGDEAVRVKSSLGMYMISGKNPYEIIDTAISDIKVKLGTFKLRTEKHKPDFMNYFGWCTWNAIGFDVSEEKILRGLSSFDDKIPKFMLLDDGWQTTNDELPNRGSWGLKSFSPKSGFDLAEAVRKSKSLGVEKFFVWHATMGYWGGVDVNSSEMSIYNPALTMAKYSDNIHRNNDSCATGSETPYGLVANDKIFDFYNDYHKYIASRGVDGVKIDTQNYVEAVSRGRGGRSVLSQKIREGMEASTQLNFGGELINCMCGQNDTTFRLKASNMVRTSDDFYPEVPVSHGAHIYYNAMNSLCVRRISWCDWDMFMTDHEYGAYHAASRAVSGGPVYVTDEIGKHDFTVISRLRLSDGTVPLCTDTAVPSPDSLMINPFTEQKAFKIMNTNRFGRVEAAFNMNADGLDVSGTVFEPAYSFNNKCIVKGDFKLPRAGFDIFTFADIVDGFGVYGLAEKYNSGGAVKNFIVNDNMACIELLDTGTLCAFCDSRPVSITCNGAEVDFTYNDGLIKADVNGKNIVISKYKK